MVGLRGVTSAPKAPPTSESFSVTQCASWFEHFCIHEDGRMTPPDILTFCQSIDKAPDDIVFLVLSFKMGVKTCGSITKLEWVTGMAHFEIDSSQKLLEKWEFLRNLLNQDPDLERNVFRFSYNYVRERDQEGGRIDVHLGMELIRMFLSAKWPYCQAFIRFLTVTKVKALTRDQFMNIIDFSRDVISLDGYDDCGAWPTLMDDFVAHVHKNESLYQSDLEPKTGCTTKHSSSSDCDLSFSDKSQFPI